MTRIEIDYYSKKQERSQLYIEIHPTFNDEDLSLLHEAVASDEENQVIEVIRSLRERKVLSTSSLTCINNSKFWLEYGKLLYNITRSLVQEGFFQRPVGNR